ncbi:hypothetical protein D3C80_1246130 [compost metagenome]
MRDRRAAAHHHHGTVWNVVLGKHQVWHAALESIGAGEHIDLALMQRLDGFLAFGERPNLGPDTQAASDQAQVIGADAQVTVAIDGDIDRLIIGKGNTHP